MGIDVEIPLCLDHEECKKMSRLVEGLTTSGENSLNEGLMKQFKKICKRSDEYVTHAYHLLLTQMGEDHAEIRFSTYLMIDELFNRSHCFRELLISEFQEFLELSVGINPGLPLPPPEAVSRKLMTKTLESIQQWQAKFGEAYKKLSLGYNFLRNCKKIDFNNIEARTVAQHQRITEQEERRRIQMNHKLEKTRKEIEGIKDEICQSLVEVRNCFQLLFPHLEDFLTPQDHQTETCNSDITCDSKTDCVSDTSSSADNKTSGGEGHIQNPTSSKTSDTDNLTNGVINPATLHSDSIEGNRKTLQNAGSKSAEALEGGNNSQTKDRTSNCEAPEAENDLDITETVEAPEGGDNEDNSGPGTLLQESGLGSHSYSINIKLNPGLSLAEDDDNTDILINLKDQNRLITTTYLPTIIKSLAVLSKAGGSEMELKAVIDLKIKLEAAKSQFSDLSVKKALGIQSFSHVTGPADSDEDDFEDVPEKEGYEPVIPPHLRKEYGLEPLAAPSSSKSTPTDWDIKNLARSKEDVKDPTSFAANVAKMHQKMASEAVGRMISQCKESSRGGNSTTDKRKDKLKQTAPVLSYGFDLESWENPNPEGPLVLKSMSLHRWWTPIENDESLSSGNLAALKSRTMKFSGEFVPVKWKCRAPLPNGKLCERMDRVKCPFHGKVIARDDLGIPADIQEDINASMAKKLKKTEQKGLFGIDDKELQRDIEAATGLDLGSGQRKGKGKGKGKGKTSNLTNIQSEKDTVRNRLEKKVFNKRSMKRVATALDDFDHKRHRDKFANSFHYSFPK